MYHDETQEVHRGNIPENHESKRKRVDDKERGKKHDFISYTIIKNNFIVYTFKNVFLSNLTILLVASCRIVYN